MNLADGKEAFGTGFLAQYNGASYFITAGHNVSNYQHVDRKLLFNNPDGKHSEEDLKNDKTIIQFSLKELIKENTEPHYKNVVSGNYFVLKIAENCDLKLRELADQAFFLHSVAPEDDSLLVLFGFPA